MIVGWGPYAYFEALKEESQPNSQLGHPMYGSNLEAQVVNQQTGHYSVSVNDLESGRR